MGRGPFTPFVWPAALLIIGLVLIALAQGLARLDGFRFYGQVQGIGEIVVVVGLAWLIAVVIKRFTTRAKRG